MACKSFGLYTLYNSVIITARTSFRVNLHCIIECSKERGVEGLGRAVGSYRHFEENTGKNIQLRKTLHILLTVNILQWL